MRDFADQNYFPLRIRTDETTTRQTVSLFELSGINTKEEGCEKVRALLLGGITTAELLMDMPTEEVVAMLLRGKVCEETPEEAFDMVEGWKDEIRELWEERGGMRRLA